MRFASLLLTLIAWDNINVKGNTTFSIDWIMRNIKILIYYLKYWEYFMKHITHKCAYWLDIYFYTYFLLIFCFLYKYVSSLKRGYFVVLITRVYLYHLPNDLASGKCEIFHDQLTDWINKWHVLWKYTDWWILSLKKGSNWSSWVFQNYSYIYKTIIFT